MTHALGCPFCDPPTGFGIVLAADANDNTIAENVVARTKEDGIRVLDFDPADPENPVPSGTVMRGNLVSHAGHDGIRGDSAAAVVTRNAAYFNHDLGIEAVPGATDGGGNRARHNGNPAQCVGVACH